MRFLDRLQDATVVRSFDRSGFLRHSRRFDPADLEERLEGRICLVTGANSGIGKATAEGLAARGAEVWLLCRNRERADTARAELTQKTGNRNIKVQIVDMSSLESVRKACSELPVNSIDVLVHNAGVLPSEMVRTGDGLELTYATNVAGPFLMTKLLLDRLEKPAGSRLIWVSSGGMLPVRLDCGQLRDPSKPFNGVTAYAQTKRAQCVLSELLAERLSGRGVTVSSMHPGWADTAAVQSSIPRFHKATKSILRSPAQGADTVVWLAVSEKASGQSGLFWFDREKAKTHIVPWTRERKADRKALWDLLEADTGAPTL